MSPRNNGFLFNKREKNLCLKWFCYYYYFFPLLLFGNEIAVNSYQVGYGQYDEKCLDGDEPYRDF